MDVAEAFQSQLRADLKAAMRSRDKMTVGVLRGLLSAIDNAQAVAVGSLHDTYVERAFGADGVEVERNSLDQDALQSLLKSEAESRRADAASLNAVGQTERAEALLVEAEIVERYVQA